MMNSLKEKFVSGNRFKGRRFLSKTLALVLLSSMALGAVGCGDVEDADPADNSAKPSANTSPASSGSAAGIDPKSLVSVNSETFLALDEIGGKLPVQNVSIPVNPQSMPKITVRGWAVDQRTKGEAGGVIVNVDGKTDVVANYGQPRPDVAANLKNPNYTNSGFIATIDASTLEKGRHTLTMRVVTADKKGYYEQKQKYDIDVQ
jgi:hypothetical protein